MPNASPEQNDCSQRRFLSYSNFAPGRIAIAGLAKITRTKGRLVGARLHQTHAGTEPDGLTRAGASSPIDPVRNLRQPRCENGLAQLPLSAMAVLYSNASIQ